MNIFLYSTLVYFFFIIYVQHFSKPFYIKYYKIICASRGQLIIIKGIDWDLFEFVYKIEVVCGIWWSTKVHMEWIPLKLFFNCSLLDQNNYNGYMCAIYIYIYIYIFLMMNSLLTKFYNNYAKIYIQHFSKQYYIKHCNIIYATLIYMYNIFQNNIT